jgi:hypothetical protein
MSNLIQTYVDRRAHAGSNNAGDSAPKHGGEWRAPCAIRDATAVARQSVYWLLKRRELHCRRLHLSTADSWLSLARRDEAMDNLLASWDRAEPVKTDGLGA